MVMGAHAWDHPHNIPFQFISIGNTESAYSQIGVPCFIYTGNL